MMKTENIENKLNPLLREEVQMSESSHYEKSTLEPLINGVLESTLDPFATTEKPWEEKPKRSKLPLFLSMTFLSAFFLGSVFGFLWGKTQENSKMAKEILVRDKEITLLIEEIKKLYADERLPNSEFIQPLLPLNEMETLAPESVS